MSENKPKDEKVMFDAMLSSLQGFARGSGTRTLLSIFLTRRLLLSYCRSAEQIWILRCDFQSFSTYRCTIIYWGEKVNVLYPEGPCAVCVCYYLLYLPLCKSRLEVSDLGGLIHITHHARHFFFLKKEMCCLRIICI